MKIVSQSRPLGVRGKILVCPLNWGLGHATRCVPIIRKLMTDGYEVVIVADGYALAFLKQEFSSLRFIEFSSYSISYSAGKSQVGAMFFQLPIIAKSIVKEHYWLNNLLKLEHFDQVISDNRFGMWNKGIYSIYITHQIMIKMPKQLWFIEKWVHRIHKAFINCYNECWIPDEENTPGLSGDLAHKYPLPHNAKFIGTLSRFKGMENILPITDFSVVAVISGIEPQRSIFENSLISRYKNSAEKVLLVCGKPQILQTEKRVGNIYMVSHLTDIQLVAVLRGANKIVCRSGYSSIMDLDAIQCLYKTEFVATPGQTEQEYLKSIHC